MFVALPSTIAYGIMSFAPLGAKYAGFAALGAVTGTIIFNFLAPFLGGTKGLVSAPSAPAAAVVSIFVVELLNRGTVAPEIIPIYVSVVTIVAGMLQFLIGNFGGGKFVKYIPYPVITGYLMGVSIQIMLGQIPKFLGLPKGTKWLEGLTSLSLWHWQSIVIGASTMIAMAVSKKVFNKLPAVVLGLGVGLLVYFLLSFGDPSMRLLAGNPLVIGSMPTSGSAIIGNIMARWSQFPQINPTVILDTIVPGLTLSLLLSITTLNTCVVLDTKTFSSHNPRRELMAQGMCNISSALACGIPCAGLMGATIENINNGAKTKYSTLCAGLITLLVLLFAGTGLAWLPLASLAGILITVASRMLDFKLFTMLKNKSTIFDFLVIITVVVAAVNLDLIKGAGVGIAMAILLFLREQMSISVIRRKLFGNQIYSKKNRLKHEREILDQKGAEAIIFELQGQLFFGTTDQLFSELEQHYAKSKYIILDMRRIQSVDFTAANMLKKILTRIQQKKGYLIFTSVPSLLPSGQNVKQYLHNLNLFDTEHLKIFETTEDALEWVEDEILNAENTERITDHHVFDLKEIEVFDDFPDDVLATVTSCLAEKTYKAGDYIFHTGDVSDEIYFVRQGTVKLVLPISPEKNYHLLTISRGGIFGEMAFIDNVRRSADAWALEDCLLSVLSRDKFDEVTVAHPDVAGRFYRKLALLTVKRLRQSNKELKVFQES